VAQFEALRSLQGRNQSQSQKETQIEVVQLQQKKRESNYFHNKLKQLGFQVIKDECVGFSHLYYFNCGCARSYSVNPLTLKDSEKLYPCEKHKHLVE
jgi:hypothetical protein